MIRRTVLAAVVLAGCAGQPPSPNAPTRVRLISAQQAAQCARLGEVELYKLRVVGGMEAATLQLRAKVAQAGGDAYVVSSQYIGPHGLFDIVADVYRCKP
jgi:hypothetical protein